MVETIHSSEPTMDSDGKTVSLISSYALRGNGSYSVFVLSRKLDGRHDGIDFGNGMTPVTLRLPFSSVQRITRYRLEGPNGSPVDPRANNRESLQVVIGSKGIDTGYFSPDFVIDENTGGESGGVPPGSIQLFVFDTSAVPPTNDPVGAGGTTNTTPDGDSAGGGGGCFISSLDQ